MSKLQALVFLFDCCGRNLATYTHCNFRIVPYVNPKFTGSISGIIGAGGNVGAVMFGLCFRQLSSKSAFTVMGSMIVCSSILGIFIFIPDESGLIWKTQVGSSATLLKEEESLDEEKSTDTAPSPGGSLNNSLQGSDSEGGSDDNDEP